MTFYEHIKILQETRQKLIDGINEDIAKAKRTAVTEYFVNVCIMPATKKQKCGYPCDSREQAEYQSKLILERDQMHTILRLRVILKVQNHIASTRL